MRLAAAIITIALCATVTTAQSYTDARGMLLLPQDNYGNPVNYWRFDNDLYDTIQNQPVIHTATPFYSNAYYGGRMALHFTNNNADACIITKFGNTLICTNGNEFTVCFWGRSGFLGFTHFINKGIWTTLAFGIALDVNNTYTYLCGTPVLTQTNFTNSWNHLGLTWDGSTAILYANGVAVSTPAVGTGADTAQILYLGNRNTMDRGSNSAIQDLRLFNRSISAEEMFNIYQQRGY